MASEPIVGLYGYQSARGIEALSLVTLDTECQNTDEDKGTDRPYPVTEEEIDAHFENDAAHDAGYIGNETVLDASDSNTNASEEEGSGFFAVVFVIIAIIFILLVIVAVVIAKKCAFKDKKKDVYIDKTEPEEEDGKAQESCDADS